jgi:hypothetical protein
VNRYDTATIADWAKDARERSRTPNLAYFAARRSTAQGPHPMSTIALLLGAPDVRDARKGVRLLNRRVRGWAKSVEGYARIARMLDTMLDVSVEKLDDDTTQYTFTVMSS